MNTAKKVLFTSHTANFQKFNRPFMRMLKEQGWEVHYASGGEEEILDADQAFVVPFERSPFKLGNVKAYFVLKKVIDREKYDMIHTHTPMGSVVTRLAARASRKAGTRVLYTAHGFHFFNGAPLINWLIYYPIEKYMARHTDTLITINNEDYRRAKKKFRTNIEYVAGVGVDPGRFEPRLTSEERNRLRKSLGVKSDDFVMIYPAELNKNKNQSMLISVMEKLTNKYPNIYLLLAGKDSLSGLHNELILAKGLSENIQLLGYRSDIAQLLMASDISVSSSYREGLPVHILEAMMARLAVVSTDCRGVDELVCDNVNGYILKPNDVNSMVEKIETIYCNPEIRSNFGTASFNLANQYSINKILTDIRVIYGVNE